VSRLLLSAVIRGVAAYAGCVLAVLAFHLVSGMSLAEMHIRILARVVAGFLIGAGWFTESSAEAIFSDPAFDLAIGALLWSVTEVYYWLAKRWGWPT